MTVSGLVKSVLVLVVASGAVAATARAADEKDVVGTWKLRYEPGDGQVREPVLTVTKDGSALMGEWVEGDQKRAVPGLRYEDGVLSFKIESKYNGEPASVTYKGKPTGDSLKGEADWEYGGMTGTFAFEGKRGVPASTAKAADEKDAVGMWKLSYDPGDGDRKPTLTVTKEQSGLVGKFDDNKGKYDVTDVKFKDGKLAFTIETKRDGEKATATFEGKVKGDAIEGDASWEYQGMSGSFPFTGKREAARPEGGSRAGDDPSFVRAEDIVYGRKFGTALTMDIFTPREHANGLGVILVVSGGWFSAHDQIRPLFVERLVARGYTVFAVVHGSQPKFTIPEILQDMNRAVRFVRYHARDYKLDPDRLGIYGFSAGGHLSLMQGTAGDRGNPDSKDPVDRTSSRVQAVACFFPPTDFLNYGKPGENALGRGVLAGFKPPFDFHDRDEKAGTFERITDEAKIREIGKQISPITHVSEDDPPTLIIQGDADKLVPIQQAESFVAKLKEAGVEAKLVAKPGAGHGWADLPKDEELLADWFDRHLKKK